MNESNHHYTPYSQNLYQQGSSAQRFTDTGLETESSQNTVLAALRKKLYTPFAITVSFFAAAVLFAVVVVVSYPNSSQEQELPVIKAQEMASYKAQPEDAGGMEVPYQDSTIFEALRDDTSAATNLLASSEEPAMPAYAFGDAAQDVAPPQRRVENLLDPEPFERKERPAPQQVASVAPEAMQVQDITEIKAQPVQATEPEAEKIITPPTRPSSLHAAGSSPETLAFVRSVLDEDDPRKVAEAMSDVQPASGGNAESVIAPGNFYVQLGSVTSAAGAEKEWGIIRKNFAGELQGADHRVQEADLGERGVYYRIQAGPMSKDSASSICEAIKARKPGGCLVVQ